MQVFGGLLALLGLDVALKFIDKKRKANKIITDNNIKLENENKIEDKNIFDDKNDLENEIILKKDQTVFFF